MNKKEILQYLDEHQDSRGVAYWERHVENTGGLRSCGIGLTRLRKLGKEIGRDARLAKQLWRTDLYEAKILSLLIDDPKAITVEQAETQVDQLAGGYLAHVFSSCDATLAKTPFVAELMETWVVSKDPVRRRCGYGLLYEISKSKKQSAPDDETFLKHIARIEKTYARQPMSVLMAMATALLGIGLRSKQLNAAAVKVAHRIGPIDFDSGGRCEPMDIERKLKSDFVKKKLKA